MDNEKIFVKRANVVLEVPADEKDDYTAQGYSILDADGKVIEEALPNDVNALKIIIGKLEKEIADLKKAAEKPKTSTAKKSAEK